MEKFLNIAVSGTIKFFITACLLQKKSFTFSDLYFFIWVCLLTSMAMISGGCTFILVNLGLSSIYHNRFLITALVMVTLISFSSYAVNYAKQISFAEGISNRLEAIKNRRYFLKKYIWKLFFTSYFFILFSPIIVGGICALMQHFVFHH